MKKQLASLVLTVALSWGHARAAEINFYSPAFEAGKTSSGLDLTDGFTFALGSFGSFVPTSLNLTEWTAHFAIVPVSGAIAWDSDLMQYSQTAVLDSNVGKFSTDDQGYVWGYNTFSLAPDAGAEWVLLTNPSWLFPSANNFSPVDWGSSDEGTIAVFGFLSPQLGEVTYLATAAASAIPEPSTYAAIVGGLALGLVALRRRASRHA
jgi:hypothetical protein